MHLAQTVLALRGFWRIEVVVAPDGRSPHTPFSRHRRFIFVRSFQANGFGNTFGHKSEHILYLINHIKPVCFICLGSRVGVIAVIIWQDQCDPKRSEETPKQGEKSQKSVILLATPASVMKTAQQVKKVKSQ